MKGFQCPGLYPYKPNVLLDDEFFASTHYRRAIQTLRPVLQQHLSNQQRYYQPLLFSPLQNFPLLLLVQDSCL